MQAHVAQTQHVSLCHAYNSLSMQANAAHAGGNAA